MADSATGSSPTDRIRDAGKWLIGASAAVGAALIAGSQLSNLGHLPLCTARSESCFRLPIALVGAALALAGIAYIMWRAVQILLPVEITIDDLIDEWERVGENWSSRRSRRAYPEIAYFRESPSQIGNADPATLKADRTAAWRSFMKAQAALVEADAAHLDNAKSELEAAKASWERAGLDVDAALSAAQYRRLLGRFTGMLRHLLISTVVSAIGITTFAWASNPGPITVDLSGTSLAGSNLRGADLTGANLDGADLTGTDLTGAVLNGASLKDVRWRRTICPDGTDSDRNDPATCLGHLTY